MSDSNPPKNDFVQEKRQHYQPIATHVSDTSEVGLETIIFEDMLARGWIAGDRHDYDRQSCVNLVKLKAFLEATQPEVAFDVPGSVIWDGDAGREQLRQLFDTIYDS